MRKVAIICAASFLAGCNPDPDGGPSRQETEKDNLEASIFYSAVVFPEGYDWQTDPDCSEGKVILVNGNSIKTELEDSRTNHFVVKGHLYDALSADGRTELREDGRSVISWEGEENIWDVAIDGRETLCLCTLADGSGTVLRRDGKPDGNYGGSWPASDFYEESGRLCFDLDGALRGCVYGGEKRLWTSTELRDARDLHLHMAGGEIWFIGHLQNGGSVFGNIGSGPKIRGENEYFTDILYGGEDVFITSVQDGRWMLRKNGKTVWETSVRFDCLGTAIEKNDVWAIGRLDGGAWALFHDGSFSILPDGVRPAGGAGMCLRYGRLMFPVVLEGGVAGIWDNGRIDSLGFNGYVDHIVIGRGCSKYFYLSR